MEHVKSPSAVIEEMFDELFLGGMADSHVHVGDKKTP